ncbi:MAG: single-stranded-DNA-specific exonuclease RecJ [Chloroflexota bacterium]|nr:single-stranded-DNA-specific exonuclease RecJ [Chloroflexota bacterium]
MELCSPRWDVYPSLSPEEIASLQIALRHLRLEPLTIQLLANRSIREPTEIEGFLSPPDIASHPDPLVMSGMSAAVDRICSAIGSHEKIVVYGDYDADGVTSTALLTIALRRFGANAEPYVPNRKREGYGLNVAAIHDIADKGAKLLVTVDCGIGGALEIAEATAHGLDVIVTDHHTLPATLPRAWALINPKQGTAGSELFSDLAGVGVAYQLVRALVKRCGQPEGLRNLDLLGLVAIGTVSDLVPLRGANRPLVMAGIKALPKHRSPGVQSLLSKAGLLGKAISTDNIGYTLGPRLNAAGRIDDAGVAYRLLMTDTIEEAAELAEQLEHFNYQRQDWTRRYVDAARQRAAVLHADNRLIFLHDPEWNSGVVGLIASRLVEDFHRPVIVLERGEEESKGSARSIPGFHMVDVLREVDHLLVRYGGHAAAAGLTVRTADLGELETSLLMVAHKLLEGQDPQPVVTADAEIRLSDVHDHTWRTAERLAPFGTGNPVPLFMARDVRVQHAQAVGKTGTHLKMVITDPELQNGNHRGLPAIAFGLAHMEESVNRNPRVDIMFHIEPNEWNGQTTLQLRIKGLRPAST